MCNTDRERHSVKRISSVAGLSINPPNSSAGDKKSHSNCERTAAWQQTRKSPSQERRFSESNDMKTEEPSYNGKANSSHNEARKFMKGPSCWYADCAKSSN